MDDMLREALREFLGLLKQLFTNLLGPNGKEWGEEFKKFLRREPCWTTRNPYLRKIAEGKLAACKGLRTLVKMAELFGFLDQDFADWGTDVPGTATGETQFEVHELVKNGTFAQILEVFGIGLDKLCWSQDQIITFVENHADLLHPKGWATFFLFRVKFDEGKETEREEFFVAIVYRLGGGQLLARVYRLSGGGVWDAECRFRFLVPQQDLAA